MSGRCFDYVQNRLDYEVIEKMVDYSEEIWVRTMPMRVEL